VVVEGRKKKPSSQFVSSTHYDHQMFFCRYTVPRWNVLFFFLLAILFTGQALTVDMPQVFQFPILINKYISNFIINKLFLIKN
jgi:hypothetical protein